MKLKAIVSPLLLGALAFTLFACNSAKQTLTDSSTDNQAFTAEQRDGYSFEMPSEWVEQDHYDGAASYGYEGKVSMIIEEVKLDSKIYPTADEQHAYLAQHVKDSSQTDPQGTLLEYRYSNLESYTLGNFQMIQATQSVYKAGTLNAKHSLLLFFISENEYVEMVCMSRPDDYDAVSQLAYRIFDSVKIAGKNT